MAGTQVTGAQQEKRAQGAVVILRDESLKYTAEDKRRFSVAWGLRVIERTDYLCRGR